MLDTLPAKGERSYPTIASLRLPDGTFPPIAGAEEPADGDGDGQGQEAQGQQPEAQEGQKPEDALGDAGKRALEAERAARKAAEKAAREAQAKVQEYEDRDKSELERAQSEAQRASERAMKAERKLAAIEAGLPAEMADRLQGSTPEELAEDAAKLAAIVKPADDGDQGGQQPPAGSLDGGARPPKPNKSLDEQILAATKDGDWETVERLNLQKLAQAAKDA